MAKKAVFFDLDETIFVNVTNSIDLHKNPDTVAIYRFGYQPLYLKLLGKAYLKPILHFCFRYHVVGFVTHGGYDESLIQRLLVDHFDISQHDAERILYANRDICNDLLYQHHAKRLEERASGVYRYYCINLSNKAYQIDYLLSESNRSIAPADIILIDDIELNCTNATIAGYTSIQAKGEDNDYEYLSVLSYQVGMFSNQPTSLELIRNYNAYSLDFIKIKAVEKFKCIIRKYLDEMHACSAAVKARTTVECERIYRLSIYNSTSVKFIIALARCLCHTREEEYSFEAYLLNDMFINKIFNTQLKVGARWALDDFTLDNLVENLRRTPLDIRVNKLYLALYLRALFNHELPGNAKVGYSLSVHGGKDAHYVYDTLTDCCAGYVIRCWKYNLNSNLRTVDLAIALCLCFNPRDFFTVLDLCLCEPGITAKDLWCDIGVSIISVTALKELHWNSTTVELADYINSRTMSHMECIVDSIPFIKLLLRAYVQLIRAMLLFKVEDLARVIFVDRCGHIHYKKVKRYDEKEDREIEKIERHEMTCLEVMDYAKGNIHLKQSVS